MSPATVDSIAWAVLRCCGLGFALLTIFLCALATDTLTDRAHRKDKP